MSTALALLARLARQDLDRQRQELARREARLSTLVDARDAVRSATIEAIGIASSTGEDLPLWAGMIEGGRRHELAIAQRIASQQSRVGAARDCLTEQFSELRRLELLAERRDLAARRHAEAQEQAEREERIAGQRSGLAGTARRSRRRLTVASLPHRAGRYS